MNQFLINTTEWIIIIPFIGFILGVILFVVFFFLIYNPIGIFKFKAVSKIAREEYADKHQWSYSTRLFQVMYFPDQIIMPEDSKRMIEAKKQLIKHVKIGWKIAIWWMSIEMFFALVSGLIIYLGR